MANLAGLQENTEILKKRGLLTSLDGGGLQTLNRLEVAQNALSNEFRWKGR